MINILKILLTIFFTGYGFSSLFIPEKLRKDSFFPIFWIGIILSVIFSAALTTARIPISQGKYVILIFSFIFLIYSVIRKKSLINFSKETFVVSIFTLICLFITITNSSLIKNSYINESEYLIGHSLTDDITKFPYNPYLKVGDSFKLGNSLFLGFIADTLGVRASNIHHILTSILLSLVFPLTYTIVRVFFKKVNKYLLMIVLLILSMTSMGFYISYNELFTQTLFLGIFVLILLFFQSYFSEQKNITGFFNSHDLLIAMGISSLSPIYPKGVIIICFLFTIYFLFNKFINERKLIFWTLAKILLLAIIINPLTFGLAFK